MCEIHTPSSNCSEYLWLYITAPLSGGFAAGIIALLHANSTTWLTIMGKDLSKKDPSMLLL
jgi:hypothetical protein